ncbi:hypothetical protein Tco_1051626, partial [Tanacetum coccineum]
LPIPDPIPEAFGGDQGGQSSNDKSQSWNEDELTLQSVYDLCISLCTQVTKQATEIKTLKAKVKKLKNQTKPFIVHHKAWVKAVKIKKQLTKKALKEKRIQDESVSKQGRNDVKSSKGEPSVPKATEWNDLDADIDDTMEYTLAQEEGTAQQQGTDKQEQGTDKPKDSTDGTKLSTNSVEEGTFEQELKSSVTPIVQTPTLPTPITSTTP